MPGLIDAAQNVGGARSGLFGYDNQREMLRPLFKTLKDQSSADPAGAGVMPLLPQQLRNWMDFSLLPDYDEVSKYFNFSVYARLGHGGRHFHQDLRAPPAGIELSRQCPDLVGWNRLPACCSGQLARCSSCKLRHYH